MFKNASPPSPEEKALLDSTNKDIRNGWHVVIPGQLCRLIKTSSGDFVIPELIRHHLSNLGDSFTLASMLNLGQMYFSKFNNTPLVSRPVACAIAAFSICVAWEVKQSTQPHRELDKNDLFCHGLSTSVFLCRRKRIGLEK